MYNVSKQDPNGIAIGEKNGKRFFKASSGKIWTITPDDPAHERWYYALARANLSDPPRDVFPAYIPPAGYLVLANRKTGKQSVMFTDARSSLLLAFDELTPPKKKQNENTPQ